MSEQTEAIYKYTMEKYGVDLLQAKRIARKVGLIGLSQVDSPEGFGAFFEAMSGMRLHSEAQKWIENAYNAHHAGRGLLQECHREAGKTTVMKFFLAFRLGHEPEKTWAIIRINDQKANQTASAIARIVESDPTWKLIFPHVEPDKTRGWGEVKGYYVKRTDMTQAEWDKVCTSTDDDPTLIGYGANSGSVLGSRFSGGVLVDDIIDGKIARSPTQCEAVEDFVTSTLRYCLKRDAWEFWNFTPWTSTDIYARLKGTGEYIHNLSPALVPAKEGDEGAEYWPPMPLNIEYPEYGNIPLSGRWYYRYWAKEWPWERFASFYRVNGHINFCRELMLDLEAVKGLNLKAEWLHYFPAEDIDPSWPVIMGIDYASTSDRLKQKDRDYFAIAIMRAVPGGGLVLVDGYRGRISKGEALAKAVSLFGVYPNTNLIGVESIGKGEEFYDDLVLANDAYGVPLPLFPIPYHQKSKGARFEDWLGPRFQTARIWVSNVETPFINEFESEWLTYPNCAFDDCLDAVYMAALAGEGHMPSSERRDSKLYKRRKEEELSPITAICRDRIEALETR